MGEAAGVSDGLAVEVQTAVAAVVVTAAEVCAVAAFGVLVSSSAAGVGADVTTGPSSVVACMTSGWLIPFIEAEHTKQLYDQKENSATQKRGRGEKTTFPLFVNAYA